MGGSGCNVVSLKITTSRALIHISIALTCEEKILQYTKIFMAINITECQKKKKDSIKTSQ
jgi:hypothetical protein